MEKEQKLVRIQKNFRIMGILTKIVEIFCYVGSGITAAGAITFIAAPEWTKYFIDLADEPDKSTMNTLVQTIQSSLEGTVGAVTACVAIIVMLLIVAFAMHKLRGALKKFAQGHSPFLEENIRTLKLIFVIITIITLLSAGLPLALLTALVLWTIYLMFQMGCELQKESDETL